jgi:hypothetical protein
MTFDVDDDNEDVSDRWPLVPGSTIGHVVKVRLRDGVVTPLTDPVNEPSYAHGSARNLLRPGWFYVTYSRDPKFAGKRFWGEVVALRTDGSGQVQRFGHYHSRRRSTRPRARGALARWARVMFGSDWADHASWPGAPACRRRARSSSMRARARDSTRGAGAAARPPLSLLGSNPSRGGLRVAVRDPGAAATALELYDLAGRRLFVADAGTLGVGEHVLDLDPVGRLEAGSLLRDLTDGHERKSLRAVVTH